MFLRSNEVVFRWIFCFIGVWSIFKVYRRFRKIERNVRVIYIVERYDFCKILFGIDF